MSTCISKEITCAKCGAKQKTQIWPSATVRQNPELRRQVLQETLFNWQCSKCGYQALVVYPFLYHDTERRFMAALNPAPHARRLESPPLADGLTKRMVRRPEELKEKILIFEAGLNDLAVELTKLALARPLIKQYRTDNVRLFFCDCLGERLNFAVFIPGETEPSYTAAQREVYDRCLGIVEEFELNTTGFLTVDRKFAAQLLAEYQKS